jgi:uncharacterized phiE125 gp8 family phage protein
MPLKLITAPTSEPISVADAKLHCRVDVVDDDLLIQRWIKTARRYIERISNRALLTQTWELWLDAFPASSEIDLNRSPLASVTHVKYYDDADAESTFAASNYIVDTIREPGRVVLKTGYTWPSTTLRAVNGVVVRFVAGWTTSDDVPEPIKQAMFLLVGYWNENREAASLGAVSREIEFSVDALLRNERVFRFA